MTNTQGWQDALKACPWCEKPVMHRFALDVSDGGTDDIIHAAPTECGMQYFSIGTADRGVTVAKHWNSRTLPAPTADRLALVESLREAIVELWHESTSDTALHVHLGMTEEEYGAWANP